MVSQDENGMIKIHKAFVITFVVAMMVLIFAFFKLDEVKKSSNNYTLVNYSRNGDTLAVYKNITDYRFRYPNIIIQIDGTKEYTVKGNFSLYK